MGASYGNVTLLTDRALLIEVCRDLALSVYISAAEFGRVTIYGKHADESMVEVSRLSALLSSKLHCAALGVNVHDDSVFQYELFNDGRKLDAYCSASNFFDESAPESKPVVNAPQFLAEVFNVDLIGIKAILEYDKASQYELADAGEMKEDDVKYVFESSRHHDLNTCLRLPRFCNYGYASLRFGDFPAGYSANEFLSI